MFKITLNRNVKEQNHFQIFFNSNNVII